MKEKGKNHVTTVVTSYYKYLNLGFFSLQM